MLVTNFAQPFLQHRLILLFDLRERHAHTVLPYVHDVTQRRKNCSMMNNAQPHPGSFRERLVHTYLATKDTEVRGLYANFVFRFHFDQVNAGRKGVATGSRPLDQRMPPKFDAANT